jgi:hypothetical protein
VEGTVINTPGLFLYSGPDVLVVLEGVADVG